MPATPDFVLKQQIFTRHCRNPEHEPAPENIEDRRMQIYRDLLYNNVENFMSNNFPVIRQIYTDEKWHALIRDYFSRHRASTPLFPKLPSEFLRFLETEREDETDPPYLLELAHYEWMESVIAMDTRELPDQDQFQTDVTSEDLLNGVIVLNPIIQLLAYQYPVYQISPEFLPEEAPSDPSYVVVYRDRQDIVGFMALNAITARLLDILSQNDDLETLEILNGIAQEMQHPDPQVVINGGMTVLQQMLERDIVLGVRS